jgi:hypothetical protein
MTRIWVWHLGGTRDPVTNRAGDLTGTMFSNSNLILRPTVTLPLSDRWMSPTLQQSSFTRPFRSVKGRHRLGSLPFSFYAVAIKNERKFFLCLDGKNHFPFK